MSDPREAILALAGEVEREPLEGVDGAFVHRLSVADWDAFVKVTENSSLDLFVRAVRDADGKQLFSEADFPAFLAMDARKFAAMSRQVMRYNGIGAAAVEAAEKNSETTPS